MIITQSQKFNKDVTILMLSWKDAPLLHSWLNAFIKYTPKSLVVETVILDNGSNDTEFDQVAKKYKKLGDFHFLKNSTNEYIPAINKLTPLAKGKYIMLAAPGAPFLNNVIGVMKQYLDSNPEIGAVSAKFMNEDGTFQNVYKKKISLPLIFLEGTIEVGRKFGVFLSRYFNLFHTVPKGTNPHKPFLIERVHLCSFMLRREAIGNELIIEPKIPLGPCDADLCKRIYKNGYKILGLPEAKVIHYRSVAFNLHKDNKKLQYKILGTLYYFRKHHPIKYHFLKLLFILDQSLTILCLTLVSNNKKAARENRQKLADHHYLFSLLLKHDINVLG